MDRFILATFHPDPFLNYLSYLMLINREPCTDKALVHRVHEKQIVHPIADICNISSSIVQDFRIDYLDSSRAKTYSQSCCSPTPLGATCQSAKSRMHSSATASLYIQRLGMRDSHPDCAVCVVTHLRRRWPVPPEYEEGSVHQYGRDDELYP